ncbi:hypothetical protein FOQG_03371 [Fusarium oxysporum f. sp. raphani 54005]|jgi:hypothetical protein|uniref:Uncharacterized protein n=4 Tax=Fusarium oxysporum TaxID=5507 RepID=X0CPB1_FUSOX|nr:hypothetical protein FOVG_00361 [Fusarium oxysporum f. sp. pisi HDV247]EXK96275.1 hypothetical protein FOQG_03371 [Fusarium oxysporum f. sp. raphani 54005]EXL89292.1 hypothetical protein FOPG_00040 [Fusarium oxysporum f. sp. conglutinans race 2 54008]EXM30491.1 hypothetical protein FOTG_04450 [Fusarium oxysporum f. sp. vasinfectum 25433]KAJ0129682.1 hypothetical protein HZ326_27220 [Fusarium oxysporum f. sp. albedinis]
MLTSSPLLTPLFRRLLRRLNLTKSQPEYAKPTQVYAKIKGHDENIISVPARHIPGAKARTGRVPWMNVTFDLTILKRQAAISQPSEALAVTQRWLCPELLRRQTLNAFRVIKSLSLITPSRTIESQAQFGWRWPHSSVITRW